MSDLQQPNSETQPVTVEQTIAWADGEYKFRIGWPQLKAIESDTDKGPMELLLDLQKGTWLVQDISSIMRHALIGGGTELSKAQKLVSTYVEGLPPETTLPTATGLLYMGVFGFKPKKATPATVEGQTDGDH